MLKNLTKKLTNNYNEVPLFLVTFNLNEYEKNGAKGSCMVKLHPALKDENVVAKLNDLIDYIRDNNDMEKLSR